MPHLPSAHHETSKRDSPNETKIKEKQNETIMDSNSNLAKSMTHHNQTKELTTWFLNYIPQLTTNILRIGQLDEAWYRVDIHGGVLKIHEPGGQLFVKVQRGDNRMYVLHLNMAQAGCLLLRGK
jgi:hypothetical protein